MSRLLCLPLFLLKLTRPVIHPPVTLPSVAAAPCAASVTGCASGSTVCTQWVCWAAGEVDSVTACSGQRSAENNVLNQITTAATSTVLGSALAPCDVGCVGEAGFETVLVAPCGVCVCVRVKEVVKSWSSDFIVHMSRTLMCDTHTHTYM